MRTNHRSLSPIQPSSETSMENRFSRGAPAPFTERAILFVVQNQSLESISLAIPLTVVSNDTWEALV